MWLFSNKTLTKSAEDLYLESHLMRIKSNFETSWSLLEQALTLDPGNPLFIKELFLHPVNGDNVKILYEMLDVDPDAKISHFRSVSSNKLKNLHIDNQIKNAVFQDFKNSNWLEEKKYAGWETRVKSDIAEESITDLGISESLIDDLIGSVGMKTPTLKSAYEHLCFVKNASKDLSLVSEYLRKLKCNEILHADLGSLIDYLFTYPVFQYFNSQKQKMNVFEVGGGYGRTAEFLLQEFENNISKYFLFDSVPSSIILSYTYLQFSFPEKKIQLLLSGQSIDDNADILIIPAWNLNSIDLPNCDLFINVESFQEMSKDFVDYWFSLIGAHMSESGFAFISNSRSYVNKGDWPIPADWKSLIMMETPRSWSTDHPSALFSKNSQTFTLTKPYFENFQNSWRLESFNKKLTLDLR